MPDGKSKFGIEGGAYLLLRIIAPRRSFDPIRQALLAPITTSSAVGPVDLKMLMDNHDWPKDKYFYRQLGSHGGVSSAATLFDRWMA